MLRLTDERTERLTTIPYREAAPGGGSRSALLAVERLRVDALPAACDAILATGDLQGVAPSPSGGAPALLGIAVADYLAVWADGGLTPAPDRIGVLLAGDLYSAPSADRRGASGPVPDVWLAFAAAGCPFVLGIAGNHDEVTAAEVATFGPEVALLDGDQSSFSDLVVAGVSGVIGDPSRPLRRSEKDFQAAITAATNPVPDILLLHEGPSGAAPDQRGNPALRNLLARRPPTLTICGHVHWDRPVSPLTSGHILNVDARAVLLTT